jgi:hypothetical protein
MKPSKGAQTRWIKRIFSANSAQHGRIVYRGVDQVRQWASLKELRAEVQERGFHLLQIGDLYVIVCQSPANIKVIG